MCMKLVTAMCMAIGIVVGMQKPAQINEVQLFEVKGWAYRGLEGSF